jgi:hypothetical protein
LGTTKETARGFPGGRGEWVSARGRRWGDPAKPSYHEASAGRNASIIESASRPDATPTTTRMPTASLLTSVVPKAAAATSRQARPKKWSVLVTGSLPPPSRAWAIHIRPPMSAAEAESFA